jgi:hypothetical protein
VFKKNWRLHAALLIPALAAIFLFYGCSRPKITTRQIDTDVVGQYIGVHRRRMPSWRFDEGEPRAIQILQSTYTRSSATLTIHMETENVRGLQQMAGRISLTYEWSSGQWNLIKLKNIDFFPAWPETNSTSVRW